jgi:hypothetical protein
VLFAGNDGGVYQSSDGGSTWSNRSAGLGAIELYGSAVSTPQQALRIYRGAQDNCVSRYDGTGPWNEVITSCDGGHEVVDPTDSTKAYAEVQGTSLSCKPGSTSELNKTVDDGASGSVAM